MVCCDKGKQCRRACARKPSVKPCRARYRATLLRRLQMGQFRAPTCQPHQGARMVAQRRSGTHLRRRRKLAQDPLHLSKPSSRRRTFKVYWASAHPQVANHACRTRYLCSRAKRAVYLCCKAMLRLNQLADHSSNSQWRRPRSPRTRHGGRPNRICHPRE